MDSFNYSSDGIESFSILGAISVLTLPAVILVIYLPGMLVYALYGFGAVAYLFVAHNTTRRRPEEQLRQRAQEAVVFVDDIMDRYHEELTAVHSMFVHNLKNKLAALKFGISYLWGDFDDKKIDEVLGGCLHDMTNAAEEAIESLKGFLSYRRGAIGKFVLSDVHPQLAVERVRIDGMPSVEVEGDAERFLLAVKNLIDNAYAAGSKHVYLSFEENIEHIYMYITDDGPGINKQSIDGLFRPFSSQKDHGTGLGLFLSRKAVRAMGGDLTIEKTGALGTTFCIKLKRYMATSTPPAGWVR